MSNTHRLAMNVVDRPLLVASRAAPTFLDGLAEQEAAAAAQAATGPFDPIPTVEAGIAVIPIRGPLFNSDFGVCFGEFYGYGAIVQAIRFAMASPDVSAILLDIRSPGGVVGGCFDAVDTIFNMRGTKPIWAVVNEMALSAAYALASAADRIIVPRTGEVGSIGVLTIHVSEKQLLERIGIKVSPIFAGKRKVDGWSFDDLSDEARAVIQASIDQSYELFVSTVARNRSLDPQSVRDTEAGIFRGLGNAAVMTGLADAVMSVEEAVSSLLAAVATGTSTAAA